MFCFTGRELNPPEGSAADAVKQKEDDGNLSLPPSKYHCCVRLNVPEGGSSSSLCSSWAAPQPSRLLLMFSPDRSVARFCSLCCRGLILMQPWPPYVMRPSPYVTADSLCLELLMLVRALCSYEAAAGLSVAALAVFSPLASALGCSSSSLPEASNRSSSSCPTKV